MAFINDTLAFITAYAEMQDENNVFYFSPADIGASQQAINTNKICVGSHPEGICYDPINQRLYVVNSGYGELNTGHPLASTISEIDINSKMMIDTFATHINPNRIYYNKGKIYVVS